jgi:RNA 2',3'-cyclic 3'-phosphodiesterase
MERRQERRSAPRSTDPTLPSFLRRAIQRRHTDQGKACRQKIRLDDIPVLFFNSVLITDWSDAPMLITDTDDRPRQGALWREQCLQHAGNLLRPPNAVFFALYPDPDTARRLGRFVWYLCDKHKLKGRPRADRCLHVTLHGIGDYAELPRDAVAAISEAVSAVTMPPFAIGFNWMKNFGRGRKRALVLVGDDGVVGLQMFQHELVTALRKIGFARRKEPPYHPHITLLYYGEGEIADQAVEEIRWTVREFVLVRSLYVQGRHLV